MFNRPDCPNWAKWAAVDDDGKARFHAEEPFVPAKFDGTWWCSEGNDSFIDGEFDASDWKNSLIKRPVALPEWCSVGEWIYIPAIGEYMQIEKVEDDLLFNKKGDHIPYTHCKQARTRPYGAAELKSLMGKPITLPDESVYLCLAYSKRHKSVVFCNMYWDAQKLMDSGCTVDDRPCCFLEHLNDDGKWVE